MSLAVVSRAAILVVTCLCAAAQTRAPAPPKPPSSSRAAPVTPRPKLTSPQRHAFQLLQAVHSQAAGLDPDMRAFALWHAARGIQTLDKKKADTWLEEAFRASQSVEERHADTDDCGMDEVCHVRRFLQGGILEDIANRSVERAEELLPYAEPSVKQSITSILISRYIEQKDLSRAQALLATAADFERYPYEAAVKVMSALPPSSPDRLSIFLQAMNNYKQRGSGATYLQGDIGEMLTRFWPSLPPDVVTDAVDTLLSDAKEQDKEHPLHVSFSTHQGKSGGFNSAYELRLFQALPILEHLDPSRAEDLLKQNATVRGMLAEYPKGISSVDPNLEGKRGWDAKAPPALFSTTYSLRSDTPQGLAGGAQEQVQAEINRQMSRVSEELTTDPKRALADASNLPLKDVRLGISPRLLTLLHIARTTLKAHPEIAKSALDEGRKNVDALEPMQRGRFLIEAADLYVRLDRRDDAQKAIEEAMKAAEKAYAKDADANDPNLAFKGVWPSTGLWWKCVQAADGIAAGLAEQLIAAIPDEEIATYQRVAYANSLLGRRESPEFAEQHKDGGASIISF